MDEEIGSKEIYFNQLLEAEYSHKRIDRGAAEQVRFGENVECFKSLTKTFHLKP